MGVLAGCRVLVADDEPLIAMNLAEELEAAGAVVVGTAASMESAVALLGCEEVDAAVLDIMLGNELVYPLADSLSARSIPYVFATGYLTEALPEKYADIPICGKPFAANAVVEALTQAAPSDGAWSRSLSRLGTLE
jgi:CheY-like chemotaxis protein